MFKEVKINGKKYPVRFGMNAMREYAKETGKSFEDLAKMGEATFDELVLMAYIAIKEGARVGKKEFTLNLEEFSDSLDGNMDAFNSIVSILAEDITASIVGKEGKEKGSNETPKKKTRKKNS